MGDPSWPAVILGMVNAAQLVALAFIGLEQSRSSRERIRRSALDDREQHLPPPVT